MVAPDGAPDRPNVSVCPSSGSVAVAVNVAVSPGFIVWSAIGARVGGVLRMGVPPTSPNAKMKVGPWVPSLSAEGVSLASQVYPDWHVNSSILPASFDCPNENSSAPTAARAAFAAASFDPAP